MHLRRQRPLPAICWPLVARSSFENLSPAFMASMAAALIAGAGTYMTAQLSSGMASTASAALLKMGFSRIVGRLPNRIVSARGSM